MDASAASGYSSGIELITNVDQPGTTGTEIDHECKHVVRAAKGWQENSDCARSPASPGLLAEQAQTIPENLHGLNWAHLIRVEKSYRYRDR
jgi:hypothetical protein